MTARGIWSEATTAGFKTCRPCFGCLTRLTREDEEKIKGQKNKK